MTETEFNKENFGYGYTMADLPDELLSVALSYGTDSIQFVNEIRAAQAVRALKVTGRMDQKTIATFRTEKQFNQNNLLIDIEGVQFFYPTTMITPPLPPIRDNLPPRLNHLWNNYGRSIEEQTKQYSIPVGIALAVFMTEAGGAAYDDNSNLVIIRFETHIFKRKTGQEATNRKHNGTQTAEWGMLSDAAQIDLNAAFYSTSFGLPQMMGFNCHTVGYKTPIDMAVAFQRDVSSQIKAFFDFCQANKLTEKIKNKDWKGFTKRYNGPGQVDHYSKVLTNNLALVQAAGFSV